MARLKKKGGGLCESSKTKNQCLLNANCKWKRSMNLRDKFKKKCFPIIKRKEIKKPKLHYAKPNPFYNRFIKTFKRKIHPLKSTELPKPMPSSRRINQQEPKPMPSPRQTSNQPERMKKAKENLETIVRDRNNMINKLKKNTNTLKQKQKQYKTSKKYNTFMKGITNKHIGLKENQIRWHNKIRLQAASILNKSKSNGKRNKKQKRLSELQREFKKLQNNDREMDIKNRKMLKTINTQEQKNQLEELKEFAEIQPTNSTLANRLEKLRHSHKVKNIQRSSSIRRKQQKIREKHLKETINKNRENETELQYLKDFFRKSSTKKPAETKKETKKYKPLYPELTSLNNTPPTIGVNRNRSSSIPFPENPITFNKRNSGKLSPKDYKKAHTLSANERLGFVNPDKLESHESLELEPAVIRSLTHKFESPVLRRASSRRKPSSGRRPSSGRKPSGETKNKKFTESLELEPAVIRSLTHKFESPVLKRASSGRKPSSGKRPSSGRKPSGKTKKKNKIRTLKERMMAIREDIIKKNGNSKNANNLAENIKKINRNKIKQTTKIRKML